MIKRERELDREKRRKEREIERERNGFSVKRKFSIYEDFPFRTISVCSTFFLGDIFKKSLKEDSLFFYSIIFQ